MKTATIIIRDEVNIKIEGLELDARKKLVNTFKYEIPGGIQAGETLEWQLQPNTFLNDEWNRDVPNGIIQIKAISFIDSSGSTVEDPWNSEKDELMQTYKKFMSN